MSALLAPLQYDFMIKALISAATLPATSTAEYTMKLATMRRRHFSGETSPPNSR